MTDQSEGGFIGLVGLAIEEVETDRVTASLDADERHHQPHGLVHGGLYCTIVETLASLGAGKWAAEAGIPAVVGVANSTDFLRPHRTGGLEAEATPIHRGRTQQLWQVVVIRQTDGKTVARGQVRLHNVHHLEAIE